MAILFEKWQRKKWLLLLGRSVPCVYWVIIYSCRWLNTFPWFSIAQPRRAGGAQREETIHIAGLPSPHLCETWRVYVFSFPFSFNLAGISVGSKCRWMFPTAAPARFCVSRCLHRSRSTRSLQPAVGKTSSDFHKNPCLQQLGLRTTALRFIIKVTRAVSKAYKNATKVKQKLYKSWACKGKQECILAIPPLCHNNQLHLLLPVKPSANMSQMSSYWSATRCIM